MFVTTFEPKSRERSPLIAIKGTSSRQDLIEDFLHKGAGYLRDLARPITDATRKVAAQIKLDIDSYRNFKLDAKVEQSLKRLIMTSDRTTVFTGHSLGGSLAYHMANLIRKEWPKGEGANHRFEVIALNPLAPEVTRNSLLGKDANLLDDFDADGKPALHFTKVITHDDPMQAINAVLSPLTWAGKVGTLLTGGGSGNENALGTTIALPSRRLSDDLGMTESSYLGGHALDSVIRDINFSRDPTAEAQLDAMIANLKSGKSERAQVIRLLRNPNGGDWIHSGARGSLDATGPEYSDWMKIERGKSLLPEMRRNLTQYKVQTLIGKRHVIGEVDDPDHPGKRKLLYSPELIPTEQLYGPFGY